MPTFNQSELTITSTWDAVAYIYTVHIRLFSRPTTRAQLVEHLKQMGNWILILAKIKRKKKYDTRIPTTTNVSWVDYSTSMVFSFGTAAAGSNPAAKAAMAELRRKNDEENPQSIFPTCLVERRENWDYGNCAESNPWTELHSFDRTIAFNTLTLYIDTKKEVEVCRNCNVRLL